jgi:hypothetical protein
MGKLVYEENKLVLYMNKVSMFDNIKNCKEGFMEPDFIKSEIPIEKDYISPYTAIIENFGDAIKKGSELIAPAVEGINSLELSNGAILSHCTGRPVSIPIDGDLFEKKLHEFIEKSNLCYTV